MRPHLAYCTLGPSAQEGHRAVGVSPEEVMIVDQRNGAPVLTV